MEGPAFDLRLPMKRYAFALLAAFTVTPTVAAQQAPVLTVTSPDVVLVERVGDGTLTVRATGSATGVSRGPRSTSLSASNVQVDLPEGTSLAVVSADEVSSATSADDRRTTTLRGPFVLEVQENGTAVLKITAQDATATVTGRPRL